MSKRIMKTITISCLLGASSTITAMPVPNQSTPLTIEQIAKEYQSYTVDYKDYPPARRSELTTHVLTTVEDETKQSVSTKAEIEQKIES